MTRLCKILHFKLQRRKFTPKGVIRQDGVAAFQTPAEEIYTIYYVAIFVVACLFQTPAEEIYTIGWDFFVFLYFVFQTPAEEIYTFARIFLTVLILISNSSGGNLHPYCRLACRLWRLISNSSGGNLHRNDAKPQDKIYPFQTPAEEIYTLLFSILGTSLNHFKLQRRKFTQR